ncbi:VOC family protein [Paenibacillus glycanilyticus]|uniref:VOC domain-containing protein n=1 Tax=Paenibacillus glycanilyticus TaxID=126569 RepID=A0ABQ6GEN6_9BACL|nr:VOC family protein [Paenibacillus glycanilyticus]GLX68046.1 hypothetical protein MU1_23910 [Paenibacillus glycanilyticus]
MRIHSIKLLTSQLVQLKEFYTQILGLPLTESTDDTFTVKVGRSSLIFEQTQTADENPFYHFAFDIPENKIDESITWLNSLGISVNLLPNNFYKWYSSTWNATSIYFDDPAGNIVEFIARHSLGNAIEASIKGTELINISEIGLVVDHVSDTKDFLGTNHSMIGYKDSNDSFAAVGDEDGLFILSANQRVWLGSDKKAAIFRTEISVEGTYEGVFDIEQYPYKLSVVNN